MKSWAVILDDEGKLSVTLHPSSPLAWAESDRLRQEYAKAIANYSANVEVMEVDIPAAIVEAIRG